MGNSRSKPEDDGGERKTPIVPGTPLAAKIDRELKRLDENLESSPFYGAGNTPARDAMYKQYKRDVEPLELELAELQDPAVPFPQPLRIAELERQIKEWQTGTYREFMLFIFYYRRLTIRQPTFGVWDPCPLMVSHHGRWVHAAHPTLQMRCTCAHRNYLGTSQDE